MVGEGCFLYSSLPRTINLRSLCKEIIHHDLYHLRRGKGETSCFNNVNKKTGQSDFVSWKPHGNCQPLKLAGKGVTMGRYSVSGQWGNHEIQFKPMVSGLVMAGPIHFCCNTKGSEVIPNEDYGLEKRGLWLVIKKVPMRGGSSAQLTWHNGFLFFFFFFSFNKYDLRKFIITGSRSLEIITLETRQKRTDERIIWNPNAHH